MVKEKLSVILIWLLIFSTFSALMANGVYQTEGSDYFRDGFETGDFSNWTGTEDGAGASQIVTSTSKHHGIYADNITLPKNTGGAWALAYTTLDSNKLEYYGRCYLRWDNLCSSTFQRGRAGPGFRDEYGYATVFSAFMHNSSGWYWGAEYWKNLTFNYIWAPFSFQEKCWYCVELYYKVSNDQGAIQLWVNGNVLINMTNLDTNDRNPNGIRRFLVLHYILVSEPTPITLLIDDCIAAPDIIGQETSPSIGEFQAPFSVVSNQYFYLNATINIGNTLPITDFDNSTIQIGEDIILQWINSTNAFSENYDPHNHATLNTSACLRTELNSTAYKLSWYVKLNNLTPSEVDITGRVFDSGGYFGSNSTENLFSLISSLSMALQAKDVYGTNLTRSVTFVGTMANGTSFVANSDLNGYATASVCYGETTIDTWWRTHLVQTSVETISSNATIDVYTRIQRLDSGSDYLLFSLNQTSLPAPSLVGFFDWIIEDVEGDGNIEFKMDNANWIEKSEPYSFSVDDDTYYGGWTFADNIFTFPLQFSSTKTLSMNWPIRNVAITNLECSKTLLAQGYNLTILVEVKNLGNLTETFDLTVYADSFAIYTQSVTLENATSTIIVVIWNSLDVEFGAYIISAYAWPIPNEANTTDNAFTLDKAVRVVIPGDIDGNSNVQLIDLVILAKAYSSKPGDPSWNPNADIDGNDAVGLADLIILAQYYGEHYP